MHAAVSACLSRHFNCYISSALIWAKREASAEPGTSKATSPSLTSCLSLWRSPGFEKPEKGIGEAAWIPGWNEFDGLIVAPSGHRHSSQRGRPSREEKLCIRSWKILPLAFPFISGYRHTALCCLSFQYPGLCIYMNVRNIPDMHHSFSQLFPY